MAQLEKLMPFILNREVGLPEKYMTLPPDEMFIRAKGMKRAYVVVPGDKGGPTLLGVTLATYTTYRRSKGYKTTTTVDLRAMTAAEWLDICRSMFWNRWHADDINTQAVANMLVDWVWGSGVKGIIYPQRVLDVPDDGIVGPMTLNAVNSYPDQHELFDRLKAARHNFHTRIVRADPTQKKFLAGWTNRVNAITFDGFDI